MSKGNASRHFEEIVKGVPRLRDQRVEESPRRPFHGGLGESGWIGFSQKMPVRLGPMAK
jgi:hypothetical protein